MSGDSSALARLQDWARAELAPWRLFKHEPQVCEAMLCSSIDNDPSMFRFSIRDGVVSFHQKTPEHFDPRPYQVLIQRGVHYQRTLQAVVTAFEITGSADIAVDLDDSLDSSPEGPVFRFQKARDTRHILLPDIDMLTDDFYLSRPVEDELPFSDKVDRAIFVGSTSGMPITREVVERLTLPRLRSAVYFKTHPDVCFELPNVVQCDNAETHAMIVALELGDRVRAWDEQFSYRYLISIDGNGATCSRVAIALKSNSLLIRYRSDYVLYYFKGLEPWVHYIPVEDDADLTENLAILRDSPGLPQLIAQDSRAFYRTYLSRIAVMHYVAELLRGYIEILGSGGSDSSPDTIFAIDTFAHVSNEGEKWANANGWIESGEYSCVEGIGFIPGPELQSDDLAYRAIDLEGRPLDTVSSWNLSGSRSLGRPIGGVQLWLSESAASRFDLSYEARFSDGAQIGPLPAGIRCAAPSGASLTAFRLIVRRRIGPASGLIQQ